MRLECSILSHRDVARSRNVVIEALNDSTLDFDVLYCVDGGDTPEPSSDESSEQEQQQPYEAYHPEVIEPQNRRQQALAPWLAQLYHNPQHCSLLYVAPDNREAVFLARQYRVDKTLVQGAHVLVGIRLVQFADEQLVVSWCTHPACQGTVYGRKFSLERAALYERLDYPRHPASTAREDSSDVCCTCATAVLEALGGTQGLLAHCSSSSDASSQSVPLLRPVQLHGKPGYAVNPGTSFESWAVVLREPSGSWRCRTCTRNTTCCKHVKLLQTDASGTVAQPVSKQQKLNEKLTRSLQENGSWKLQCISRHALPWDVADDPHLHTIYTERNSGGNEVPGVCTPDLDQACSECGCAAWEAPAVPTGAPECVVFYKGAFGHTCFAEAKCSTSGCNGRAVVDGYEYGLLRQSTKYAFCHTLLYSWRHQLVPYPRPWYHFWRSTLQDYKNASQQQLRSWMVRDKQFEQATKDFINLMGLDWESGFQCPHGLQGGVILDGITLGFKLANACFVKPWQCGVHEEPVVWGSHFQERILVHDEKLRHSIAQYAELGPSAPGLSEEGYQKMLDKVRRLPADCPEHFLEPFLQRSIPSTHPGFCRAPPPWRSMLYTVGCPHPMSRYIKVPLFSTVEKLVRGEQLPLRDVSLLQRQAPLLHEFLRNYLAAGMLPREVRELLSAMLKVAKQAVIPQRRRNTIPPVLQRARQQQQQGQELASTTAGLQPPSSPETWTREEAFLRTGCFSAFHTEPWSPSVLGGSDILRSTRLYGADYQRDPTDDCEGCSKPGSQHAALLPGCLFYYCLCCRRCIGFHVMDHVESPRMPFEFFYTRCQEPPAIICYDNGCNEEQYCLAREPEFFSAVDFYVDASHWVTHTNCPPAYSSGSNPAIVCSPLAEQKNAFIGALRGMMSSADQLTFLWFVRLYMFAMNKYEAEKAAGACFYYKPHSKLKRGKRFKKKARVG